MARESAMMCVAFRRSRADFVALRSEILAPETDVRRRVEPVKSVRRAKHKGYEVFKGAVRRTLSEEVSLWRRGIEDWRAATPAIIF